MRQSIDKRADLQAREEYERRCIDFNERILWHLNNGFVISVPYLFCMGYFYEDCGDTVMFVTCAFGQIDRLFRFDLNYVVDKIEFERNFSGKTRRYDYAKFKARIK